MAKRDNSLTLPHIQTKVGKIKDIENLAIILVPLIMILSSGHIGQIKG